MKRYSSMAVLLFAVLLLSACEISTVEQVPAVDENSKITEAVQTVYAQITQTAFAQQQQNTPTDTALPPTNTPLPATATATFTNTPAFTHTPTLTQTFTPAPVSHCPLAQVTRETLPAGSNVIQGQWLIKQWTVLNAGDCEWTTDFAIVYYDGERFNLPLVKNFHVGVLPDDFFIITFEFAAPQALGTHKSWWMMRSTTGELFGNGPGDIPLYIEINVEKADN